MSFHFLKVGSCEDIKGLLGKMMEKDLLPFVLNFQLIEISS